jgi:Na+-translocating ferredoxin:NAD+ oxidoreductase RnfD subunit
MQVGKLWSFDPRVYQIATLSCLLLYGVTVLDFGIDVPRILAVLATALFTQLVCSEWKAIRFDPKSALISALSLCLLLRSNSMTIYVVAAFVAIASKFVIRIRGKHLFNPTNIAIVAMLLFTQNAWVSPAQWGNAAFFGFLMACAGALVVNRAARSDVTYAFIVAFVSLIFYRALFLGDPMSIPLHKLQSGALLLFAFFMISDPKTTPDSRLGRIIFAVLVAWGGWYLQVKFFRSEGLLYSLAFFSLFTPLIDLISRGEHYEWRSRRQPETPTVVPLARPTPVNAVTT